jgi:DNA-binding phage protein
MALTRDFKLFQANNLGEDEARPEFRQALFTEALNAYLTGDTATGKAMLRDLINATIGFEQLAHEVKKPSKSLHRMLGLDGNPNTENFFGIVSALQRKTKMRLSVTAR